MLKKTIAVMIALMLVLGFAACGEDKADPSQVITKNDTEDNGEKAPDAFFCEVNGTGVIIGEEMDEALKGKALSSYEVPSCAIEGTDHVYTFEHCEITAITEGDGSPETVYMIYFLDPEMKTPEGLAIGDAADRITELYGEDYEAKGSAYVYSAGDTLLTVIADNGAVISVEYSLVIE